MTWRIGNWSYYERNSFVFLPEFYTDFTYTKDNFMNDQVQLDSTTTELPQTQVPEEKVFVQTDKEVSEETTENVVPQ